MSNEMETKSDTDKNNEQLNLKVIGQDGEAVQFKIKRSTPFRKVSCLYLIIENLLALKFWCENSYTS